MVFSKRRPPVTELPPRRISTSAGQRLSVILENSHATAPPPPLPHGSAPRPRRHSLSAFPSAPLGAHRSPQRKHLSLPPGRGSFDGDGLPPLITKLRPSAGSTPAQSYSYSVWSDPPLSTAPTLVETLGERVREQTSALSDRRGGWRRLAIALLVLVLLAIALGVGLGLGLRRDDREEDATTDADGPPAVAGDDDGGASHSTPPRDFPAGKWAIPVFLDTEQQNCTSDPETWTCYPSITYYEDPTAAGATFDWIIRASSDVDAHPTYTIESGPNPFSVTFPPVRLARADAGTDAEHYSFQLTTTKTVRPTVSLTDDGSAAVCSYAATTFQASLYTTMARDYRAADAGGGLFGDADYQPWPYAVRVEQMASAGDGVPTCYRSEDGAPSGDAIDLPPVTAGGLCSCLYRNWFTPS